MAIKVDLLIIDPQNDFCKKPEEGATLSVPGAGDDMDRLALFIDKYGDRFNDIHVTLDSHHLFDIAHPMFCKDASGKHPDPFTIITHDDVKTGKIMTVLPSLQGLLMRYTKALEDSKRYPLMIWPPHCIIGTDGANIYPSVMKALLNWERTQFATIDFITKGSNPFTEHYSAVAAEVQDPENTDPSIMPNIRFFQMLENSDIVLVAGEASSHCVANTVMDMINMFPNAEQYTKKLVFLEDASSPVAGCESLTTTFLTEMTKNGMSISKTTEFFK